MKLIFDVEYDVYLACKVVLECEEATRKLCVTHQHQKINGKFEIIIQSVRRRIDQPWSIELVVLRQRKFGHDVYRANGTYVDVFDAYNDFLAALRKGGIRKWLNDHYEGPLTHEF